jgi:hypothetical protein
MGWEVAWLSDTGTDPVLETGDWPPGVRPAAPDPHRYRRPYEGTDAPRDAMQAYLDWEYGLVAQLARDATHGFKVLAAP